MLRRAERVLLHLSASLHDVHSTNLGTAIHGVECDANAPTLPVGGHVHVFAIPAIFLGLNPDITQ